MKVKAKTPVRYKGETIPAGQEFEISKEDYELHAKVLKKVTGKDAPEPEKGAPEERKLVDLKTGELKALAEKVGIEGFAEMKRADLIAAIESHNLTGLL